MSALRRSVARAFGPSGAARPEGGEPPASAEPAGSRPARVNALFSELQTEIERVLQSPRAPGKAAGVAPLRFQRAHPRPEGLEAVLEGASTLRLLNTMDGVVRVDAREGGSHRPLAMVTLHADGRTLRPIARPVGIARAAFVYTSAPDLARRLVRAAGRPLGGSRGGGEQPVVNREGAS